jgi:hypothetical protein
MKKTPKVTTATPTAIKAMAVKTGQLAETHERMFAAVEAIMKAHANRDAILEAANEDGRPGDESDITATVFRLKEEVDFLRQLADGFDNYAIEMVMDDWTPPTRVVTWDHVRAFLPTLMAAEAQLSVDLDAAQTAKDVEAAFAKLKAVTIEAITAMWKDTDDRNSLDKLMIFQDSISFSKILRRDFMGEKI